MKRMVKSALAGLVLLGSLATLAPNALAENTDPPRTGKISGRSVVGGVLSFLVWPGIGQAVNNNKGDKVITHAVVGLLPPFRFWSGYDALVDRKGGYWNGKI
ncbi:MAG TPA: hypothetical protein V6C99_08730 [Oculatellaceae cyanobacterium]|jgi:hypothetical protein